MWGTISVSLTKWTSDKPVFSKQTGRGSHHESGGKQRGWWRHHEGGASREVGRDTMRVGQAERAGTSRQGGDKQTGRGQAPPLQCNEASCQARPWSSYMHNRRKAHYKLEG